MYTKGCKLPIEQLNGKDARVDGNGKRVEDNVFHRNIDAKTIMQKIHSPDNIKYQNEILATKTLLLTCTPRPID